MQSREHELKNTPRHIYDDIREQYIIHMVDQQLIGLGLNSLVSLNSEWFEFKRLTRIELRRKFEYEKV